MVVTVGSINLIYQFWVHTEHVPKLGWYEWIFVTPSNHRVHHAQNDRYMDRNYGGLFILWDRLFGTFQEELAEEPVVFGIRGPLQSWSPVKALTHIYVDMAQDSWRTARWRDKLRVWVARTGWRPADVAAQYPREKNDLSHFERYDPKVPTRVSVYGFFQLVSVVLLLNFMERRAAVLLAGLCRLGDIAGHHGDHCAVAGGQARLRPAQVGVAATGRYRCAAGARHTIRLGRQRPGLGLGLRCPEPVVPVALVAHAAGARHGARRLGESIVLAQQFWFQAGGSTAIVEVDDPAHDAGIELHRAIQQVGGGLHLGPVQLPDL